MKKILLTISCLVFIVIGAVAQYKKDGTPDMRFKANKEMYGTGIRQTSGYNNFRTTYQSGYVKRNGTFVQPHIKTTKNNTNWDNYSTKGNINSYTGASGSKAKDYSKEAINYGHGRIIYTGPKGGQYYFNEKGNKVYVPKR